MRFSAVTVVAVSAFASASVLYSRQIPGCASDCFLSAGANSGCSITDNPCLCKDRKFLDAFNMCIAVKCSPQDAQTGIDASASICRDLGVTT